MTNPLEMLFASPEDTEKEEAKKNKKNRKCLKTDPVL